MASHSAIVKKGKNCLEIAETILKEIKAGSGNSEETILQLSLLKNDASFLASESNIIVQRYEAKDKLCQEKVADFSREIGKLKEQQDLLSKQKSEKESALAGQRKILADNESQLSSAEHDLREAERKLREATKDERRRLTTAAVVGGVIGLLTGGIGGLIFGSAAGAGAGAFVNACEEDKKDALSARNRRREDVDSAMAAIRRSEDLIKSHESKIQSISKLISTLENQCEKIHKERGKIKAAIPIAKKSIEFWKRFEQAAESGKNQTDLLAENIAMANKASNDYRSRSSRGIQCTASTFFEAWKEIALMASEGSSNSMEYLCANCHTESNGLPYLSGSENVCCSCYKALQTE